MKEKFLPLLKKINPGLELKITEIQSPVMDFETHDNYMVSYSAGARNFRAVIKQVPKKKREIINPIRYQIKREAGLLQECSKGKYGFNVPRVLFLDTKGRVLGRPALVMECINGKALGPLNLKAGPAKRKKFLLTLVNIMADIHRADLSRLGFLDCPDFGLHTISDLERTARIAAKFSKTREKKFASRSLEVLKRNIPKRTDTALLHGDLVPAHILTTPSGKTYVIDWDAAIIGDRSWDVFWMMKGCTKEIYGADRNVILRLYENLSGRKLLNPDFYEASALLLNYLYSIYAIKKEPRHPYMNLVVKSIPIIKNMLDDKLEHFPK
ncbi:MAG: phosphotransferase [Candidatus Micrarchaeota archaeon]